MSLIGVVPSHTVNLTVSLNCVAKRGYVNVALPSLPCTRSSPLKYVVAPLKSTLIALLVRSVALNVTLIPTVLPSTSVAAVNSEVGVPAKGSALKFLTLVKSSLVRVCFA